MVEAATTYLAQLGSGSQVCDVVVVSCGSIAVGTPVGASDGWLEGDSDGWQMTRAAASAAPGPHEPTSGQQLPWKMHSSGLQLHVQSSSPENPQKEGPNANSLQMRSPSSDTSSQKLVVDDTHRGLQGFSGMHGVADGAADGVVDGFVVGERVGAVVSDIVGDAVGFFVGFRDGSCVGLRVGFGVDGEFDGATDGPVVGLLDGS